MVIKRFLKINGVERRRKNERYMNEKNRNLKMLGRKKNMMKKKTMTAKK